MKADGDAIEQPPGSWYNLLSGKVDSTNATGQAQADLLNRIGELIDRLRLRSTPAIEEMMGQ